MKNPLIKFRNFNKNSKPANLGRSIKHRISCLSSSPNRASKACSDVGNVLYCNEQIFKKLIRCMTP